MLYRHPPGTAMRPAIQAHLLALERALAQAGSPDRVVYHNSFDEDPSVRLKSFEPDAVVLHTTFLCMRWSDHFGTFNWRYRWLRDLPCHKLAIPQDEYDHAEILDEWLAYLGIATVFTNFDSARRQPIYPILRDSDVLFHEVLTGYIDEEMASSAGAHPVSLAARPLDVVYRASHLPYWFGEHGQLKHRIAEVVEEHAARLGLRTDISTRYEDVIYGDAWTGFLQSGRSIIGAESGSSALDRRGEVRAAFETLLATEPGLTFEEASAHLRPGWDGHDLTAISPRHFEAIVTKTCQLLVEGRYSGVLEAGRHYLAIKRDFSNLDEILEQVRDDALLARIAETAYEEIYLSGRFTYDVFGRQLVEALADARSRRRVRRALAPIVLQGGGTGGRLGEMVGAVVGRAQTEIPAAKGLPTPQLSGRPRRLHFPGFRAFAHYGRLVSLAGRGASEMAVRPILARYLLHAGWREIPMRAVLRELLRLGLARRSQTFRDLVSPGPDGDLLVWRRPEGDNEMSIVAGNDAAGSVDLGTANYEFVALTALWQRFGSGT